MNVNKALISLAIGFGWVMALDAVAQETVYTRCVNGQGEVVIVTNHTCPRGYWRSN